MSHLTGDDASAEVNHLLASGFDELAVVFALGTSATRCTERLKMSKGQT
jgi:hypothetical protein